MIAWKKKRSVSVSFYLLICISCKISYMQWYTQEIIKISCSKFEKGRVCLWFCMFPGRGIDRGERCWWISSDCFVCVRGSFWGFQSSDDFNFTLAQERGILVVPDVFSHGNHSLFKLQECSIALCKCQTISDLNTTHRSHSSAAFFVTKGRNACRKGVIKAWYRVYAFVVIDKYWGIVPDCLAKSGCFLKYNFFLSTFRSFFKFLYFGPRISSLTGGCQIPLSVVHLLLLLLCSPRKCK